MEKKIKGLPPLKRFRYIEKENQEPESDAVSSPQLPAKKRKESRNPLPFCPNFSSTYCLPAKKRIWAPPIPSNLSPHKPFSPFDLNVEYNPLSDFDPEPEPGPEQEKAVTITDVEHNPSSEFDTEQEKAVTITDVEYNPSSEFDPEPKPDQEKAVTITDVEEDGKIDHDDDDGILCAVCQSTDGDPLDPIVFCDGCDLMVHKTCYGEPLINGVPEGDWFCTQCISSQSSNHKSFTCCLCPVIGGALKPTADNRWAHVVCAVYVPEVFFKDPEGREGIDCSRVPLRRWEQICYVCGCKNGCVIECSEPKCGLSFHVTCGLKEELCIEYIEGKKNGDIVAGFCKKHSDLWIKQQQTGKFKIVATDEDNH